MRPSARPASALPPSLWWPTWTRWPTATTRDGGRVSATSCANRFGGVSPSSLSRALGVRHFIELGPGTELSGMVKRTVEGAGRLHVATPEDLPGLAGDIAAAT